MPRDYGLPELPPRYHESDQLECWLDRKNLTLWEIGSCRFCSTALPALPPIPFHALSDILMEAYWLAEDEIDYPETGEIFRLVTADDFQIAHEFILLAVDEDSK